MSYFPMTEIPAEPVWGIVVGLVLIALMVLILPFKIKLIEHNLEVFFLVMGILAVTVAWQWSVTLVIDALKSPVMIRSLPIGIFQVVLIFGLLIYYFYKPFYRAVQKLVDRLSVRIFIFILIVVLGLISSIISVIVTSVILAEIVAALPLRNSDRIKLVVVACFSVGLGAVLTPLGEPMSTILVQKLVGAPYNAGFTWPLLHFWYYILPGCLVLSLFGAIWIGRKSAAPESSGSSPVPSPEYTETLRTVVMRAVKVFAFIAALTLLGEGLKPLIIWYLMKVPAIALFWINMISAVLDNATLTAIEVDVQMVMPQITSVVLGLLIAGGMLIPGNIPNIVAAGRLKISMRDWAIYGVPIGLVIMAIYFVILLVTGVFS
jgi:predicted cation transporter